MTEDAGLPQPGTLFRLAAGFLLAAAVFAVAIVLDYTSQAGHLHGATWLGFLLGVVLAGVLAGFGYIQVRLRRERQRRGALGGWLAAAGVVAVAGAGTLSGSPNATFGGALLVAGLGICLGLGLTALHFARRPRQPD